MKKLIILLFIILTSSCSYKGVIVSNLPFLITNRVDNRFDLTSDQAKVFKDDIKKLLKDKKNEVKSFNEKFQVFNIESSNRKDFYLSIRDSYINIANSVIPSLTRLMLSLSNEQRTEYFKEDKKKLDKRENKLNNRASDFYVSRFERFFGDLTESQKTLIKKRSTSMKQSSLRVLTKRRLFHKQLKLLFEIGDKNLKDQISDAFKNYVDKSTRYKDREAFFMALDEFIPTLSRDQIEYFNENKADVGEWISLYLSKY